MMIEFVQALIDHRNYLAIHGLFTASLLILPMAYLTIHMLKDFKRQPTQQELMNRIWKFIWLSLLVFVLSGIFTWALFHYLDGQPAT